MKKIILPVISILSITVFFSCHDSDDGGGTTWPKSVSRCCDCDTMRTQDWDAFHQYEKAYVEAMVAYYYSLPKSNKNIIGTISFKGPKLKKYITHVELFKIIVGAYKADTLGNKMGDRAAIVQIKRNGKYYYYDYGELFPAGAVVKALCPPPDDKPCPIEYDNEPDSTQ